VRALVVIALAAGCSSEDLCNDPQVSGQTCFTVQLNGSIDVGVLDQVMIDDTYYSHGYGDKLITVRSTTAPDPSQNDLGVAKLPVSFPLVYGTASAPQSHARILAIAYYAGQPVGIGTVEPGGGNGTSTGAHAHFTIKLHPTSSDTECFDHAKTAGSGETDIDCGGPDCPGCLSGKACGDAFELDFTGKLNCVYPLVCTDTLADGTSVSPNACLPPSTK
jgi:hypothetical protein